MFQSVAVAVICHVFLVGPTETKSNETICKCLPRCNLRRPNLATHTHAIHVLKCLKLALFGLSRAVNQRLPTLCQVTIQSVSLSIAPVPLAATLASPNGP